MKFSAFIACLIVTIDCVENALGEQSLFGAGFTWIWWIVAAIWALYTLLWFAAWLSKSVKIQTDERV